KQSSWPAGWKRGARLPGAWQAEHSRTAWAPRRENPPETEAWSKTVPVPNERVLWQASQVVGKPAAAWSTTLLAVAWKSSTWQPKQEGSSGLKAPSRPSAWHASQATWRWEPVRGKAVP